MAVRIGITGCLLVLVVESLLGFGPGGMQSVPIVTQNGAEFNVECGAKRFQEPLFDRKPAVDS